MSETPSVPTPKGVPGIFKRKVGGVPVLYLAAAFVAILALVAWKLAPSAAKQEADSLAAVDDETDGALASGSGESADGRLPTVPTGTVIVAPATPEPDAAPYEDNSTWLRKAVAFLISKGENPGAAQLAMQAYLSGATLSYTQGILRDKAVRELGLPPNDFDAGPTLANPRGGSTPIPVTPLKPAPKPTAPPAPKPSPPKAVYYIVRPGDTLSKIATRYAIRGGWQALYRIPGNPTVIGRDPNKIRPGMRIRVR